MKKSLIKNYDMSEFKVKSFFIVLYIYLYIGIVLKVMSFSKEFSSYLFLLCDLSLIVLGLMFINDNRNRFIFRLFLIFIVTSTFTYAVNSDVSIISHINGMREYLIIFAAYSFANVVFASEYRDLFLNKFYGFIKLFLIVQIPVTFFQFLKYGANDQVGGTFGPGNTGTLTITIFILCFYLIWIQYNRHLVDRFNYRFNLSVLPFFLPILLNETKISFFFFFLFFLFQLNLSRKALVSNIILLIFAVGVFNVYNNYIASGGTANVVFDRQFYDKYLFMDYEKGDVDIARFTKISIATEILSQDFLSTLFGKGIGIFKGGKLLERSEFSVKYLWLLRGSRPYLFFLLMQGGVLNTLIILMLLFYPLIKGSKRVALRNGNILQLKNLQYFIAATLVLILFYNDSLRNGAVVMIISSISMLIYNHKISHNMDVRHQEIKLKSI